MTEKEKKLALKTASLLTQAVESLGEWNFERQRNSGRFDKITDGLEQFKNDLRHMAAYLRMRAS